MGYENCPHAIGAMVRYAAEHIGRSIYLTETGIGTTDDTLRAHFLVRPSPRSPVHRRPYRRATEREHPGRARSSGRPMIDGAQTPTKKRQWVRRSLGCLRGVAEIALIAFTAIGGWEMLGSLRKPSAPFDTRALPHARDYARAGAWLAWPGRNGLERSTPPGIAAVDERATPADVFFVHLTTFKGSAVWVAPFDASDKAAPLNAPALLGQASVFMSPCAAARSSG